MRTRLPISTMLLAGLFAATAHAATLPDACGNDRLKLQVQSLKHEPLSGAPSEGMARIVFVQAVSGEPETTPVTRIAIDGTWVAANKGASYVVFEVKPGEHQMCANRQTAIKPGESKTEILKLSAVAGQTLFYELKIVSTGSDIQAHPADQMLGFASPDMTAKRQVESGETASISAINAQTGTDLTRMLPLAASKK